MPTQIIIVQIGVAKAAADDTAKIHAMRAGLLIKMQRLWTRKTVRLGRLSLTAVSNADNDINRLRGGTRWWLRQLLNRHLERVHID
jgi:hypothetical protein